MADGPKKLTCAEFQVLLPELIASGEDTTLHPHAQTCASCRTLMADLETIARVARGMFPGDGPLIN